jgi:hypothetical protein
MGDPAGIGPEIILKALSGDNGARIRAQCRPLVVGSAEMLRYAAAVLGLGAADLRRVESADAVAETAGVEDAIAVWDLPLDPHRCRRASKGRRRGERRWRRSARRRTGPGGTGRRHRDRAAEQGGDSTGPASLTPATQNCWPI